MKLKYDEFLNLPVMVVDKITNIIISKCEIGLQLTPQELELAEHIKTYYESMDNMHLDSERKKLENILLNPQRQQLERLWDL